MDLTEKRQQSVSDISTVSKYKVLVVDDDDDHRIILDYKLTQIGYEVILADNGEHGLSLFKEKKPDIVLLDVMMPKLDGYEVCRQIKGMTNDFIPVIILTVNSDMNSKVTGLNNGADDYLTKPYQMEELCARIQAMLRIKILHERMKRMQLELERMAKYDQLTGLLNRYLFQDRLHDALNRSKRTNLPLAVIFLDLVGFKPINDIKGHTYGDEVLKAVAMRLQQSVRAVDTIARWGGDEFILIIEKMNKMPDIVNVAQRILDTLGNRIKIKSEEIELGVSIGIACFPEDGLESDELIVNAELAMQDAKKKNAHSFVFFNHKLSQEISRRQDLVDKLKLALLNDEFVLHFQPQIELTTRRVTGVEALIRWLHNDQIIPPIQFIPLLEEIGLIIPVGEWVLRKACQEVRSWDKSIGKCHLRIAVNFSVRQFKQKNLVSMISQVLRETQLEPNRLDFEVTENLVMEDVESSKHILETLKEMGIRICIDDFGTGYSSLSYLKKFPVNMIKIDRAFIKDIPAPDDSIIAKAMITLGHSLGLSVLGEGIETEEQLKVLRNFGCDEGQGFYFARPMSSEQVESYLKNNSTNSKF